MNLDKFTEEQKGVLLEQAKSMKSNGKSTEDIQKMVELQGDKWDYESAQKSNQEKPGYIEQVFSIFADLPTPVKAIKDIANFGLELAGKEKILEPLTGVQKSVAQGQGFTFQHLDEIGGGLSQLTGGDYTETRDKIRGIAKQARETAPLVSDFNEVVGSTGALLTNPVRRVLGPIMGPASSGLGRRILGGMGVGSLEGGVTGFGESKGTSVPEMGMKTLIGAGVGGLLGSASETVAPLGNAIYRQGKKLLGIEDSAETIAQQELGKVFEDMYVHDKLKEKYPDLSKPEAIERHVHQYADEHGMTVGEATDFLKNTTIESMKYNTINREPAIDAMRQRENQRDVNFADDMERAAGIETEKSSERINRIEELTKLKEQRAKLSEVGSEAEIIAREKLDADIKAREENIAYAHRDLDLLKTPEGKESFMSPQNIQDEGRKIDFGTANLVEAANARKPKATIIGDDPYNIKLQERQAQFYDMDGMNELDETQQLIYKDPHFQQIAKDAMKEAPVNNPKFYAYRLPGDFNPPVTVNSNGRPNSIETNRQKFKNEVKDEWFGWFDKIHKQNSEFPISGLLKEDPAAQATYFKWAEKNRDKINPIDKENLLEASVRNRRDWMKKARSANTEINNIKDSFQMQHLPTRQPPENYLEIKDSFDPDLQKEYDNYLTLEKNLDPESFAYFRLMKGMKKTDGNTKAGVPESYGDLERNEINWINSPRGQFGEEPDMPNIKYQDTLEDARGEAEKYRNVLQGKADENVDWENVRSKQEESYNARIKEDEQSIQNLKDALDLKRNINVNAKFIKKRQEFEDKFGINSQDLSDEKLGNLIDKLEQTKLFRTRRRQQEVDENGIPLGTNTRQMKNELADFKDLTAEDLAEDVDLISRTEGGAQLVERKVYDVADALNRGLSNSPESTIRLINSPQFSKKMLALTSKLPLDLKNQTSGGQALIDHFVNKANQALMYRSTSQKGLGELGITELPEKGASWPIIAARLGVGGVLTAKGHLAGVSSLLQAAREGNKNVKRSLFDRAEREAKGLLTPGQGLNTPLNEMNINEIRAALRKKGLTDKERAALMSAFINLSVQGTKGFLPQ